MTDTVVVATQEIVVVASSPPPAAVEVVAAEQGPPGPSRTVNGIAPDTSGNITLGAHDVGAYTQAETNAAVAGALSSSETFATAAETAAQAAAEGYTYAQAAIDGKDAATLASAASFATAADATLRAGLATVARTGAYSDLTGAPSLGTAAAHAATDFDAAGTAAAAVASMTYMNLLGRPEKYPEDFGPCDTLAHTTAAVKAWAAATGVRKRMTSGATYAINDTIAFAAGWDVDFRDAIIDGSAVPTDRDILLMQGSTGVAQAVSALSFTSGTAAVTNGAAFAAGAIALLASTDLWWLSDSGSPYNCQEIVEVESVSGNVVTFTGPVLPVYLTSITLTPIAAASETLFAGGLVKGPGTGVLNMSTNSSQAAFRLKYCIKPKIVDLTAVYHDYCALLLYDCWKFRASGIDASRGWGNGLAYGVATIGCGLGEVSDLTGHELRHAFTAGGDTISRGIVVQGVRASAMRDAACDSHPQAEGLIFSDIWASMVIGADSGVDGVIMQGAGGSIRGVRIVGPTNSAVRVQALVNNPHAVANFDVSDVVADFQATLTSGTAQSGLVVEVESAAAVTVNASNILVSGGTHAAYIHAISGNLAGITLSGVATGLLPQGQRGIYLTAETGYSISNFEITGWNLRIGDGTDVIMVNSVPVGGIVRGMIGPGVGAIANVSGSGFGVRTSNCDSVDVAPSKFVAAGTGSFQELQLAGTNMRSRAGPSTPLRISASTALSYDLHHGQHLTVLPGGSLSIAKGNVKDGFSCSFTNVSGDDLAPALSGFDLPGPTNALGATKIVQGGRGILTAYTSDGAAMGVTLTGDLLPAVTATTGLLDFATSQKLRWVYGPTSSYAAAASFARSTAAAQIVYSASAVLTDIAAGTPRWFGLGASGATTCLYIEPAATNLLSYSEDFTSWHNGSSVTANNLTAPNGTATADTYVEPAGSNNHQVWQSPTLAPGSYSTSVFIRPGSPGRTEARITSTGAVYPVGYATSYYRLYNDSVYNAQNCAASIAAFGNSWFWCQQNNWTITSGTPQIALLTAYNDDSLTVGDGTSTLGYWRGQCEKGPVSTSPIPAANASGYRAADAATLTFSAAQIAGGFTVIVDFILPNTAATVGADQIVVQADDGTNNNRVALRNVAGGATLDGIVEIAGRAPTSTGSAGTLTAGAETKALIAVDAVGVYVLLNGGAVKNLAANVPAALTKLRLGLDAAGAGFGMGVKICDVYPFKVPASAAQALLSALS